MVPSAQVSRVQAARRSRPLWAGGLRFALLAVAGFVIGVVAFNYIIMPLLLGHGDEVQVPDIVGRSTASARQVLESEGLRVGQIVEQWSASFPEGIVTDQDPVAMSRVKSGREVRITVSIGSEGQEVPDLSGADMRAAQVMLAKAGLRAGRVAMAHSQTVDKDAVITSDPPPDAHIEPQTRVDLLVSLGPEPITYLVPDLRGRHVDEVSSLLERSGIRLTTRTRSVPDATAGEILEQQPPPGYRIQNGELLELVVASGRGGWR